jgi:hypothetical protein
VTYASYTGHETLTFPDYLDLSAGRTLTAKPGQSYDVAPASGRLVPDVPAGWFTSLEGQKRSEEEAAPGEAAEPEHDAEPEPEHHDGEAGEPQQF